MPHEEVLRSRLDALRDHLRRLIGPPVGRGGGAGAFIPPPVPPFLGGLNMVFGSLFLDSGVAVFVRDDIFNTGLPNRMVATVALRFRGFAVFVTTNTLTESVFVRIMRNNAPIAELTVNPGQLGAISDPTVSLNIAQNDLVHFQAETPTSAVGVWRGVAVTTAERV